MGWPVLEGDDFHSAANIAKMADGNPLTDQDREAWIQAIRREADARSDPDLVLACSALSPAVRAWLSAGSLRELIWLWLDIRPDEAARRVAARSSHFMPADLVASQFESLQPPPDAVRLSANLPVHQLAERALTHLQRGAATDPARR
jgi:gluconokinase